MTLYLNKEVIDGKNTQSLLSKCTKVSISVNPRVCRVVCGDDHGTVAEDTLEVIDSIQPLPS